jgi:CMP-N-acetylneuraminic acid synthetase
MRVLGLVPARGGSKSIPRKNLKRLGGVPLLEYTAKSALAAERITRCVLSTDDPEIAEMGARYGLEVPFRRPAHLATDTAGMLPVVQHALTWFAEQNETFNAVCLLQPTHPFRAPGDIDGALALFERTEADTVITVVPVPQRYSPHWIYLKSPDGTLRLSTGVSEPIPRRQDFTPAFRREGSVYITRTFVLMERNSFYGPRTLGYEVDPSLDIDIDEESDWSRAEEVIHSRVTVAAASLE